jgi:hypothetical protein
MDATPLRQAIGGRPAALAIEGGKPMGGNPYVVVVIAASGIPGGLRPSGETALSFAIACNEENQSC